MLRIIVWSSGTLILYNLIFPKTFSSVAFLHEIINNTYNLPITAVMVDQRWLIMAIWPL